MTTKHTPAPWTQGRSPAGITCVWLDGATEPPHEMGPCKSWIDCNTEANARLIAAAPDLLEALQSLLPMLDEWHDEFPDHVGDKEGPAINAARAAIAKATGEQQ